jgi:hypothetical protein
MLNYYFKNQARIPKIDLFLVHIVHKPNTRTFWGTLKICLEVETIVVCVSVNNYLSCCVKFACQIFYTYISCCLFFFSDLHLHNNTQFFAM